VTARARTGAVLIVIALLAMLPPAAAIGDADPASDVLLGESVFYPYEPPVSAAIERTLNAETAAAARAHFPIKVALIATPVDLGAIPALFGKPQAYADFLGQEISFGGPQPLLVVMPSGYGVNALGQAATSAAARLPKPAGAQTNDLARAAIAAVPVLAAAARHPIASVHPTASTTTPPTPGPSPALLIGVLAVVAVATAAVVVVLRRRAARAGSPDAQRLDRRR
jgi:hypothetical protein